jgi:hypothetical protein
MYRPQDGAGLGRRPPPVLPVLRPCARASRADPIEPAGSVAHPRRARRLPDVNGRFHTDECERLSTRCTHPRSVVLWCLFLAHDYPSRAAMCRRYSACSPPTHGPRVSLHTEVYARLERIRELWRELERTRPTSGRYDALVEKIRTESSAYLTLLQTQPDRDRAQPDRDRTHDPAPATIAVLPPPNAVHGHLERIKELWIELEGTSKTSARYEALVEMIHAESLAGDFDGWHDFTAPDTSPAGKVSGGERGFARRQE